MFKNFYYFYFNSTKESQINFTIGQKLKGVIFFVLTNWLILFFFEVFIMTLLIVFGIIEEPKAKQHHQTDSLGIALTLGICVPVFEEVVNRLWIVYSRLNLSIPLGAIGGGLFFKLYTKGHSTSWYNDFIPLFTAIIIGFIVIGLVYFFLKRWSAEIEMFWVSKQKIIVIFSAVLFGYLHLTGYEVTLKVILFSPLILSTYLTLGFILGYVRLRYGFFYNCLIHIIHNSVLILIKFIK